VRRDSTSSVWHLEVLVLACLALVVGACQPEARRVDASEPAVREQIAGDAEEDVEGTSTASTGRSIAVVTPEDEVYLGAFGLLAPTVPSLALGLYASECDLIDDPFESCL
jgi:hypothetical protein